MSVYSASIMSIRCQLGVKGGLTHHASVRLQKPSFALTSARKESRRNDTVNIGRGYSVMVGAADTEATCLSPSGSETARTIVDLAAYGTLSTVGENGIPLGTYVTYVLDQVGQPILRLRKDAVHTANVLRENRCSLFVQPAEYPAHMLARVTLIGCVEPVSEEIAASAAELHRTLHSGGVGVDEPKDDDLYYRLVVDECFYVGQLAGNSAAEVLSGDEYRNACADPTRTFAASLVKSMNTDRFEDVVRICSQKMQVDMDEIVRAEMAWIDKQGVYMKVSAGGPLQTIRVPFERPIEDERDARSALTMMAQVAWETDRPYAPVPAVTVSSE
ncbi:hypothetical protein M9434_003028 [Picochlorum sp. BPE23]|nr:hypothetical protein M9434_003028 [Picochlorum sp. BPE23]